MEPKDSKEISRRDFSSYLIAAGAGALGLSVFYPIVRYANPPRVDWERKIKVAGMVKDWDVDTHRNVVLNGKTVIVIRKKDGRFVAYETLCHRVDCEITYYSDQESIFCVCKGDRFDLTGKFLGGSRPMSLKQIKVRTNTKLKNRNEITEVIVES